MIRYQCVHCAVRLESDPSYAGQKISCPQCGRPLIVPGLGAPGAAAGDAPAGAAAGGPQPEAQGGGTMIALMAAGIAIILGVVVFIATRPGEPEQPARAAATSMHEQALQDQLKRNHDLHIKARDAARSGDNAEAIKLYEELVYEMEGLAEPYRVGLGEVRKELEALKAGETSQPPAEDQPETPTPEAEPRAEEQRQTPEPEAEQPQ